MMRRKLFFVLLGFLLGGLFFFFSSFSIKAVEAIKFKGKCVDEGCDFYKPFYPEYSLSCLRKFRVDEFGEQKCECVCTGTKKAEPGAAGVESGLSGGEVRLEEFVRKILTFSLGIGGGIAFLLMLWGGLTIILSAGNPEKVKAGKEIITSAIAGLLLIIFSVFILRLIGYDILRIPGFAP
jgi:hypothetical protein